MTKRLLPLLLLLALLPSVGRADVSATAPPVRPAPTESGLAAGSPLLPRGVIAQAQDTGSIYVGVDGPETIDTETLDDGRGGITT